MSGTHVWYPGLVPKTGFVTSFSYRRHGGVTSVARPVGPASRPAGLSSERQTRYSSAVNTTVQAAQGGHLEAEEQSIQRDHDGHREDGTVLISRYRDARDDHTR